jgi:hypothetical protein
MTIEPEFIVPNVPDDTFLDDLAKAPISALPNDWHRIENANTGLSFFEQAVLYGQERALQIGLSKLRETFQNSELPDNLLRRGQLSRNLIKLIADRGWKVADRLFQCFEEYPNILQNQTFVTLDDPGGQTPLHYAAWSGITGLFQLLIQVCEGAEKLKPQMLQLDNWGESPIHYALQGGRNETALFLLDLYGDDKAVEVSNRRGETILHFALRMMNTTPDTISALLALPSGRTLMASRDFEGMTPLQVALGQFEFARAAKQSSVVIDSARARVMLLLSHLYQNGAPAEFIRGFLEMPAVGHPVAGNSPRLPCVEKSRLTLHKAQESSVSKYQHVELYLDLGLCSPVSRFRLYLDEQLPYLSGLHFLLALQSVTLPSLGCDGDSKLCLDSRWPSCGNQEYFECTGNRSRTEAKEFLRFLHAQGLSSTPALSN